MWEIVIPIAECIGANESRLLAAHRMAEPGAGARSIFGQDAHLKGVLTERDIVTKVLANDKIQWQPPPTNRFRGKPSSSARTTRHRRFCAH
ncbi:hypothetical protein ACFXPY_41870 [Streptomyces sp. NPDC059153]|uniref:hypothetical protein n=1 Tax=Streptomyces sp. NPDC059153 TaxID=3346743 RepID=UPI00369C44A1